MVDADSARPADALTPIGQEPQELIVAKSRKHSRQGGRPSTRLPSAGEFFDACASTPNRRRNVRVAGSLCRHSQLEYCTFSTAPPQTSTTPNETSFDVFRAHQDAQQGGGDGQNNGATSEHTRTDPGGDETRDGDQSSGEGPESDNASPMPWKQLGLLAFVALAEQTALNSIGPYLPAMIRSFDCVPEDQTAVYIGVLASVFALAQLATNLLWGTLSDTIGRKPVVMAGAAFLAICFVFFGACRNYTQLLVVHVAMGLLNGNAAVVPTCLGEATDRSNQSRAFAWLPVIYSIGSITGPAGGGLLVGPPEAPLPYLIPNLVSAALLLLSVVVVGIWFEETLDGTEHEAAISRFWRVACCGRRRWRHKSRGNAEGPSSSPLNGYDDVVARERQSLLGVVRSANGDVVTDTASMSSVNRRSTFWQLADRTTVAILATYLVFQFSNISFNNLYPIFASAPPPTGRRLAPDTIGLSMAASGLATILFQAFAFVPIKARIGNLGTYRVALLGLALSMALMPWIGYLDEQPTLGLGSGKSWLCGELGAILIIKNACAVGGLSSVMLLITNSAPSRETLGTLNGIAQTLSAAGRSAGPALSGGLFTLSAQIQPKGEVLAWGLFAGVSLVGWLGTLVIRGDGLESDDWAGGDDEDECSQTNE